MKSRVLTVALGLVVAFLLLLGGLAVTVYGFGKDILLSYLPSSSHTHQEGNVLKVSLSGSSSYFTSQVGIDWIDEKLTVSSPFFSVLAEIYAAAENPDVKALYLDCDGGIGGNKLDELVQAIEWFKKSKKAVYAYAEIYSYSSLTIASIADQVFCSPTGFINAKGFASFDNYYPALFSKLGVSVEVFKHGNYKSAPASYSDMQPSFYDSLQTIEMLQSMHDYRVNMIANQRQLPQDSVRKWIDQFSIRIPEIAQAKGVIDGILTEEQFKLLLKSELELEELELFSANTYTAEEAWKLILEARTDIEIEIGEEVSDIGIFALHGEIIEGEYREGTISSKEVRRFLESKQNLQPKHWILHWNSPGGSARGSEQIRSVLHEMAKETPMSSYFASIGASGAVLVASASKSWYCSPNSIFGSIGVFALYPNFSGVLKQFRVEREGQQTGPYATFGDPFLPMSSDHRAIIQQQVDQLYDEFLAHVSYARNLKTDSVDAYAQGRVYTGFQAEETPLVDGVLTFTSYLEKEIKKIGKSAVSIDWFITKQPIQGIDVLAELAEIQSWTNPEEFAISLQKMEKMKMKIPFKIEE